MRLFLALVFVLTNGFARQGVTFERPYTPSVHEYRENGVPFVFTDPNEIAQEPVRSEIPKAEESEDSQFVQVTDEDTPVDHDEIVGEKNLTASRPWKAPDYSGQENALGYSSEAFAVPKGLEIQVQFWKDIYAKYHSDQGVIHDADYIDLIYEVIDFSYISSRNDLTAGQKQAAKKRMVKDAKNRVIALLEELSKTTEPEKLSPEKKKIWDYFTKIEGKDKFLAASKKNRLRFQLGQRDRVIQGIYFSGRYIEEFEKIFKDAGLPIELVRLPFVESSFNVLARSKVGASGLWQIMPYTMKGFMKRDLSIDLRNHPVEATKLAAKLMRNNYNLLQSWPLAMTGYNHGPNGVLKLTRKFQSRDIGELVAQKAFGFASRNFYASYLAILEVSNNAPKYLGNVAWSEPLESVDIKTKLPIKYSDILRWFDKDDLKAQVFNPHITKIARNNKRSIPPGFVISVPKSKLEVVKKEFETQANLKAAQLAGGDIRTPSNATAETQSTPYKVRRGDSLKKIASEFGVSESEIIGLNNLSRKNKLRAGQIIQIP